MLLWSFEGVREPRAFTISAVLPAGKHLFPFRTEKLSLPGPMVLGGQPPGRVGRRQFLRREPPERAALLIAHVRSRQEPQPGLPQLRLRPLRPLEHEAPARVRAAVLL